MKVIFGKNIAIDPKVLGGKPIVKGTRVPVDIILAKLAQGIPTNEILKDYPRLTREQIKEILAYAHSLVDNEEVFPLDR